MSRYKRLVNIITAVIASAVAIITLTACNSEKSAQFFDFGTFIEADISGKSSADALDGLSMLFDGLDAAYDAENPNGDVYKINNASADVEIDVSAETYALIEVCKKMYEETDGVFNIATYGLSELWKFTSKTYNQYATDYSAPSAADVTAELVHCNLDDLILLGNGKIKKSDGDLKIGFGAVLKGYAGDRAFDKGILTENHTGILNVGGTIFTFGEKDFSIGIGNPRESDFSYFAKLSLSGGAIACTSGDYHRYYTVGNKRYCHIIGTDGYPVDNGIISVTVVSENGAADGATCDVLSTSVFALGREKGALLAKAYGVGLVIIYNDNTYTLDGIREGAFTLKDTGYSENVRKS